jgi:hypothetical protein
MFITTAVLIILVATAAVATRVRITSSSNAVLYDLISPDNTCNVAPVLPGVSWGFSFFKVHIAFVFALHGSPNPDCIHDAANSSLSTVQPGTPLTGRIAGTNINLGTNIMIVTASATTTAAAAIVLWFVVLVFLL